MAALLLRFMKIGSYLYKYKYLILIFVVALTLRVYKLGSVPPHLTPDEAAIGYNAYSILQTGRDEYGQLFPIVFKSFGDYKPGLYIYSAVPSIAVLGLNEFSVRLPGAIAGSIGVIFLYFVVAELFASHKIFHSSKLGYISALLLAISPWHIHFSRGAWEVNLGLTLTLVGIYFFLIALRKNKYLLLSAVSFGLTLLAYQGAKLSSAIVLAVLTMVYFTQVKKIERKVLAKSLLLGLVISLPIILSLFQGKGGRLSVFSVFSYPRDESFIESFIKESGVAKNSIAYHLFYSESQNFSRGIMGRFFNHFSGRFLLFEGDWQNPRHTAPNHGVLLLADIPMLLIGIYILAKHRKDKALLFVAVWLVLAPLPSVLSRDQVHAVRSLHLSIPLTIVSALGIYSMITLKARHLSYISFLCIGALYLIAFLYFLDAYFVHLPKHYSKYWEYGYREIVHTTLPFIDTREKILIQQSYAQPYIYFLFYGVGKRKEFSPSEYQMHAKLRESKVGDVGQIDQVGSVYFVPIDWSITRGEHGSIVVGDTLKIPPSDSPEGNEFHIVNEIKYLDNVYTAFRVIDIKQR